METAAGRALTPTLALSLGVSLGLGLFTSTPKKNAKWPWVLVLEGDRQPTRYTQASEGQLLYGNDF